MTDDTAAPDEIEEVESEAPEDTATSGDDATDETKAKEDSEKEPEKKPRRNRRSESKRIAQLTAQVRERERELERLQAQMNQPKPDAGKAPKREEFDDYEEYIEAKAEYRALQAAEKRLSEAEASRKQEASKAQEDQQTTAFYEAREATLDKGAELYDDFEEVVSSDDLSISPVMAEVILATENGHNLWYHLGKHPEVAEKVASLHPLLQAAELGRISATLTAGKKVSNAPKPTKSPEQRGTNPNGLSDNLPIEEWMKRRREQVRRS